MCIIHMLLELFPGFNIKYSMMKDYSLNGNIGEYPMDNKLSLEKITTLLQAADKIRNTANSPSRGEDDVSVSLDRMSRIKDTLEVISGFLPEAHRLPFSNALHSCDRYCGTYCSLKNHLRGLKGQEPDLNHVLSTLKVVMPMLETSQMVPVRKAVSVLEALRD